MKIHIGCGPVYLEDYVNCDMQLPNHFLAKDRPDLVERNKTTKDRYYTKSVTRKDIEDRKFNKEEVVVDTYASAFRLPFPDNYLDEIYSNQLFEHFTFKQGKELLAHWHRKLKPRGIVRIDIPDLDGTINDYFNAKTIADKKWATRLLFGSQKNEYGLHKAMYSKETIAEALHEVGFRDLDFLPNIHFYPGFEVVGVKQ